MGLTYKQKELILEIDRRTKEVLSLGGDELKLLDKMFELMPGIKTTVTSNSKEELDMYAREYGGFCYYMKLLEQLSRCIENGTISVPE